MNVSEVGNWRGSGIDVVIVKGIFLVLGLWRVLVVDRYMDVRRKVDGLNEG